MTDFTHDFFDQDPAAVLDLRIPAPAGVVWHLHADE
jgi:hypothetical protein